MRELKNDLESRTEQQDDDDDEDDQPTEPPIPRAQQLPKQPKILPLAPDDEIEHYLMTFERIATVCGWPKENWALQLIPLLTGKPRSAYVLMDFNDSANYEKVKEMILASMKSHVTYRKQFCALDIHPGETLREL